MKKLTKKDLWQEWRELFVAFGEISVQLSNLHAEGKITGGCLLMHDRAGSYAGKKLLNVAYSKKLSIPKMQVLFSMYRKDYEEAKTFIEKVTAGEIIHGCMKMENGIKMVFDSKLGWIPIRTD